MATNEHEPRAKDHGDPRMRELGRKLSDNSRGWRKLDELKREYRRTGGMNDARRYTVHQATLELASTKRAIADAMTKVDPEFRTTELAGVIKDMEVAIRDAQTAVDRWDPQE